MPSEQKKIIFAGACFLVLAALFFCFPKNHVFALGLEINYPELPGAKPPLNMEFDKYALYIFNAGIFIGYFAVFIGLAWAGVMYFLSPIKSGFMSDAKERLSGAISGLLILTLTYLIAITINPQLNAFKLDKPPEIPANSIPQKAPGVYLYTDRACSDDDAQVKTSSSGDLGDLKNKVRGVELVTDPDNESFYVTVFYDKSDFWGRCQYINPDEGCTKINPFADSVTIYRLEPEPEGDGVYFYRKSCFNRADTPLAGSQLVSYCNSKSGGYYKVTNDEIKTGGNGSENAENLMFTMDLNRLHFTGQRGGACTVPEQEQDCAKYDKNGNCLQRSCPSLGGENISSILINGTYSVILSYAGLGETCESAENAFCQNFPLEGDRSRIGPQQIKWEQIMNINEEDIGGKIPNCVTIVPIKNY